MEKLTFRQSWRAMADLWKKSRKQLILLVLLILLPALLIRVYSFHIVYGDFSIRYDKVSLEDITTALTEKGLTGAGEKFAEIFPEEDEELTFSDAALDIVFLGLSLALDLGVVYFGLKAYFDRDPAGEEKRRWLFRSLLQLIFFSVFVQWALARGEAFVRALVLQTAAMTHYSVVFGSSSWSGLFFGAAGALLFVTLLSVYLQFMTVLCLSGRTRLFLSFGYAREMLRKRTWREIVHLLPFTVFSFLLPVLMQSVGMLCMQYSKIAGLILAGASLIPEIIACTATWLFLIPDVFRIEKQSGIREKIEAAIKERENRHDDTGE